MLAITQEPMEAARAFATSTGWRVTVGVDRGRTLHDAYAVREYPTVVVVGRDGRIAHRGAGVPAETVEGWVTEQLDK